jgi:hypothetical protein
VAAAILESLGAFGIALAQVVYVCQPFAQWAVPTERLNALARLLEDPEGRDRFVGYLREMGS